VRLLKHTLVDKFLHYRHRIREEQHRKPKKKLTMNQKHTIES